MEMNKDKMYHIGLTKKDIQGAKYAILPGDPGRVSKIAKYLKKTELLKVNREYTSYLGELADEKVLVIAIPKGRSKIYGFEFEYESKSN